MAKGCRDCKRCTEAVATGCILSPFRLVLWVMTFWNIGLFVRKCPQCGHRMRLHQRRADGSFKD
jgi:hypothetical protein